MSRLLIIYTILAAATGCGRKTEQTTVQNKDIVELLFASGTLEAENTYNLTADTDGYITSLFFDEGDLIKKGDVFARIENQQNDVNAEAGRRLLDIAKSNTHPDAPQLLQAEANLEAARAKLKQDEVQLERYRRLESTGSVSQLEYENAVLAYTNSVASLKSQEEQYHNLKIQLHQQLIMQEQQYGISRVSQQSNNLKILVPGKIYSLKKEAGDFVKKGEILATIGSPDKLVAMLSIDESNMGKVKEGQPVDISLNINNNKRYGATIAEIKPSFDKQEQSFFIKATFDDSLDFNLAGTQLEANIRVATKDNVVVIPTAFLGYGNKVLLANDHEVEVKTGIVSSEWVEVIEGLQSEQIIKRKVD